MAASTSWSGSTGPHTRIAASADVARKGEGPPLRVDVAYIGECAGRDTSRYPATATQLLHRFGTRIGEQLQDPRGADVALATT